MLVGRERELAFLAERVGVRGPAAVLGPAGVGKTALLRAAASESGFRTLEGGGLATLSWLPYLPLSRAVGRELEPGDPTYVAVEVEAAAGDGLLLVDDLQWADAGTLAVLALLADRLPALAAVRRGDPGSEAALKALRGSGFELVELEPLAPEDAAALVRARRPGLSAAAVERVVERAGGSPFLLEELADHDEPTESLRRALAARLRLLSPEAREAMALLALAGRPLELPHGARELADAGLVVADRGHATPRHALLAETLVDGLEAEERARLHRHVAALVDDAGERARHFAAAGDRTHAVELATAAAEAAATPGERAAHLRVAASCAYGPAANALRLAAANALIDAGQHSAVQPLLDEMTVTEPELLAEADLLRARALWSTGESEAAKEAVRQGLARVRGTAVPVEIRLLIDEARLTLLSDWDTKRAIELGTAALAPARQQGVDEARARYNLGTAHYIAGTDAWPELLGTAVTMARDTGEVEVECAAANNLVAAHESNGDPEVGRALAHEMIERTSELRVAAWTQQFRAMLVNLEWHLGNLDAAVELADALLLEPLEFRTRHQALTTLCLSLVDLGDLERAVRELGRLESEGADDPFVRANAAATRAELELWGGRAQRRWRAQRRRSRAASATWALLRSSR